MAPEPELLSQHTFDAAELVRRYPARPRDARKQSLFRRMAEWPAPSGALHVSRWAEAPLPSSFEGGMGPELMLEPTPIVYRTDPPESERWVLNFANTQLFVAYGGPAMAQDEFQVLEHPVLASLSEQMRADAGPVSGVTSEASRATPILVEGAERVAELDLQFYGHRFRSASPEQLARALRPCRPRVRSRILALESIPFGTGWYSVDEVGRLVATATAGFRAAVRRTRGRDAERDTIIHTGFWGCGAYGGSRVLSALVQMVAAKLADVDDLVLHTFDESGLLLAEEAEERYFELVEKEERRIETRALLESIAAHGYRWGTSDGT